MTALWTKAYPKQHRKLNRAAMLARTRRLNRPRQPRKKIRGRSNRMQRLMIYYNQRRHEYMALHPNCSMHGNCHATQIHHQRGRSGTLLLDERFWKPVCAAAHALIQEHPDIARRTGLLCQRGDWNRPPDDAQTARLKQLITELTI